jgi:transposase
LYQDRTIKVKSSRTVKNNKSGFEEIKSWISKCRDKNQPDTRVKIVMEATGTYYENLAYALSEESSYKMSVLLPNVVKAFGKSLNVNSKTDLIDAGVMARMGLERNLDEWKRPEESFRKIRNMGRERDGLLEERVVVSNKLHALQNSHKPEKSVIKRLKARETFLSKQIKESEKEMKDAIKSNEELTNEVARLKKIPGVGLLTAAIVLAETDNFNLIRNKAQLVSYAGLDVVDRQSGSSVNGKSKISKRGNSRLRKALYFPAITHVTSNGIYANKLMPIIIRTGIKMKAYVAIQRKLLVLMYTLHKNKTEYDKDFLIKKSQLAPAAK